jgi:hypothetical protein
VSQTECEFLTFQKSTEKKNSKVYFFSADLRMLNVSLTCIDKTWRLVPMLPSFKIHHIFQSFTISRMGDSESIDFLTAIGVSEAEVIALTGLAPVTFHQIWNKYCGRDTPIRRPIYLWWVFMYLKLYPVARSFRVIHSGRYKNAGYFLGKLHGWMVS